MIYQNSALVVAIALSFQLLLTGVRCMRHDFPKTAEIPGSNNGALGEFTNLPLEISASGENNFIFMFSEAELIDRYHLVVVNTDSTAELGLKDVSQLGSQRRRSVGISFKFQDLPINTDSVQLCMADSNGVLIQCSTPIPVESNQDLVDLQMENETEITPVSPAKSENRGRTPWYLKRPKLPLWKKKKEPDWASSNMFAEI